MRNTSPPKCGSVSPRSASKPRPRSPTSRPDRENLPLPRRPTDRVLDGFDFFAFASLQRAVLSGAGVLGDRRAADAVDVAQRHGEARASLGAQQHLAVAG